MTIADLAAQFREQVGQSQEQPQQQAPEYSAPTGGGIADLAAQFRQNVGYGQPAIEQPAPEMETSGGYWNDPKRVALHYFDILADNGTTNWAARGIDPAFVEQAYKYYQSQNKGLPFYEWSGLAPGDQFNQFLSSYAAPTPDSQLIWGQQTPYFDRLMQELGLVSQDGTIMPAHTLTSHHGSVWLPRSPRPARCRLR